LATSDLPRFFVDGNGTLHAALFGRLCLHEIGIADYD